MQNQIFLQDGQNEDIPNTIRRELCFYGAPEDDSQPCYVTANPTLKGRRNYDHTRATVSIQDARGREEEFSLSLHGFSLLQGLHIPSIDFDSPSEIENAYLPFVRNTISSLVGNVKRIFPFDVTIRRASAKGREERPVRKVHIDQSGKGAYLRAKHELDSDPDILNDLLENRVRYRIINLWKPINHSIRDHPLVFADSRTVAESDLVPVKHVYPRYTGEALAVRYSAEHKYWFWSGMTVNEAILLQCFDNIGEVKETGRQHAARCAHASFSVSGAEDEPSWRESIEVRCIVITSV